MKTIEELKLIREVCLHTRCDKCDYGKGKDCINQELSNRKCFTAPMYWTDGDIERILKEEK